MEMNVQLPCGVLGEDGTVNRDAVIQSMTARVKKDLGDKKVRNDPTLAQDTILQSCVVSVAGKTGLQSNQLQSLLTADRDYLVFQIRKLSLGDAIRGKIICSKESCKEEQGIEMSIDGDFPVYAIPDTSEVVVPENGSPFRVFHVRSPEHDLDMTFRYETGTDRRAIAKTLADNPIEGHMKLLGRCLVEAKVMGEPVKGPVGISYFEMLTIPAWEYLSAAFLGNAPGMDMSVKVDCLACHTENYWEMDPQDFFGQSGVERVLKKR